MFQLMIPTFVSESSEIIQNIDLCCYYLNLSALIWPSIFWQMLSYLRDRNALPVCGQMAPRAPQLMWRYLALCAFRYSGYLEIQPHCTLARDRPTCWTLRKLLTRLGYMGTCQTLTFSVHAPSFGLNCWSFAMWKCPQLSFCIVHLLQCAHTLSFHFLCNVHR